MGRPIGILCTDNRDDFFSGVDTCVPKSGDAATSGAMFPSSAVYTNDTVVQRDRDVESHLSGISADPLVAGSIHRCQRFHVDAQAEMLVACDESVPGRRAAGALCDIERRYPVFVHTEVHFKIPRDHPHDFLTGHEPKLLASPSLREVTKRHRTRMRRLTDAAVRLLGTADDIQLIGGRKRARFSATRGS